MVSKAFKIFLAIDLLLLAGFSPVASQSKQITPAASVPEVSATTQSEPTFVAAPLSQDINSSMNLYRKSKSLNELSAPAQLCEWAAQRAQEASLQFNHDKFYSHFNSGEWQRFEHMGENLYRGNIFPRTIIEAWDKSPGHKENNIDNWSFGCSASVGDVAVFLFAR